MITAVAVLFGAALPVAWGQSTAAPSIKFLSPTSFAGEMPVLTDTNTAANAAYRLSAWTGNAPQGSLVEFELVPGNLLTKAVTIGAGQPVTGDTYEYQWDIAEGPTGVAEGTHELRVILYDGNNEQIAADAIQVNIVHGTTDRTGDVPSWDLTYPISGGPLGQYTASNGRTNSVMDSVTQAGRVRFTVQAWFTTSAPGTSPVWKMCNGGESAVDYEDGVRCTYPIDDPATKEVDEGIDPTTVTAAGVAGKTREDGTADVVRVLPYQQEPTGASSQVVAKSSTSGGPSATAAVGTFSKPKDPKDAAGFPCSDWFRVKLTDQLGRTVAGANVDAHAQGPSDQLKFHNSYLSASSPPVFQPPGEEHSFPESAARCMSTHDTDAQQGEHSLGGQADRKHIETVFGSRDDGTIDFALLPDQPGTAQLTVWVDKNDDDKFCSGEPSTSAAFGWGTDQAPPTNGEQPSDCGAITVPDDPAEEPLDGSRSAGIEPTATAVKAGRSTTIVGSIEAADELCEASQTLKLKAKKASARRFRTVSTLTTDAFGLVSFRVQVERTKLYRVVAPAAGECALAKSTIRKIRAI